MRKRLFPAVAALALLIVPTSSAFASAIGGDTQVTITAGDLVLSGAVPQNFADVQLTGSAQTTQADLGTYTVNDQRGTGAGWHVQFQASRFACTSQDSGCPSNGNQMPEGSLTMAVPTVSLHGGGHGSGNTADPTIDYSGAALDGGSTVQVAHADVDSGMAYYDFTPGANALSLSVPANVYATTYHSTLTVSIGSGPGA